MLRWNSLSICLLLGFVVIGGSGCTVTQGLVDYIHYNDSCNDFVIGFRNDIWAAQSWRENEECFAGQPHLNAAQVAATPFLDVPRERQMAFSEVVRSTRILRKQREAANKNLEKTFAVMLHQAFTGDLTLNWREAHMKELLSEMEGLYSEMESQTPADRGSDPFQSERVDYLAQSDESITIQPQQEMRYRRR